MDICLAGQLTRGFKDSYDEYDKKLDVEYEIERLCPGLEVRIPESDQYIIVDMTATKLPTQEVKDQLTKFLELYGSKETIKQLQALQV